MADSDSAVVHNALNMALCEAFNVHAGGAKHRYSSIQLCMAEEDNSSWCYERNSSRSS